MQTRRNTRLQADNSAEIVTAPNLKAAYRKVHRLYGDDAVISGTRTVIHRSEMGLGQERLVEVTVGMGVPVPSSQSIYPAPAERASYGHPRRGAGLVEPGQVPTAKAIGVELDRIDSLIESMTRQLENGGHASKILPGGPIGRVLKAAGTRTETISRLVQRFSAETGEDSQDRPKLLTWLVKQIPAANCQWDGFHGCHAFMGYSRPERMKLVLNSSARFRELERKTLVLVLFPEQEGDVRELQIQAAKHGFDAAIIRHEDQLQKCEEHFASYDVVLLELPDLDSGFMSHDGAIHRWLAENSGFHRHLVLPMDCDVEDMGPISADARHWNCDWLALTRTVRMRRQGKLLDIIEKVPLPVSLCMKQMVDGVDLSIAKAGELLDEILAAGSDLESSPGENPQWVASGRGD